MRNRLLLIFIALEVVFTATSFGRSLPDELRWSPVALTEVMQKDSLAPDGVPGETIESESSLAAEDSLRQRDWWYLFKKGKLNMRDSTVVWPKFLKFCVDVYNWGDEVFSSTDTAYVAGTGKRWRARLINDNWNDSYYIHFSKELRSLMSGDMHVLAGASIQYMAVSYSYMFDLSHLIGGGPINYKKQEFSFNCARFAAEGYYYSNKNGTYIRTFGDYRDSRNRKVFKLPFSGIEMTNSGIDAYYFINGYKYSQAAAYGFSKLQKKSQGSFMAGFSYCNQDISVDFRKLPDELKPYASGFEQAYRFHYHNYNALLGYGYNCVLSPHWLYNITAMPGIGFNHCYEDSQEGIADLFSLNIHGKTSFTYNNGNWFAGLQGQFRGYWYNSNKYSLFSTVQSIVLSGGYRF